MSTVYQLPAGVIGSLHELTPVKFQLLLAPPLKTREAENVS